MDDFRLRVFITAAKTLNFTKCAEQLYISQPAVSKHIGELESRYKVQLFERSGSRLALTEAGRVMLEHAERIADGYRRLQYEMDLFTDRLGGELKVGASTTIAQYVLPQVLARFTARFPEVKVSLASGNSEQVEAALARHDTDLGLVESSARHPGFHYEPFIPDELVLIASTKGRYGRCDQVTLAELQTVPLVLRESGSGTLEVISKYLAALLRDFTGRFRMWDRRRIRSGTRECGGLSSETIGRLFVACGRVVMRTFSGPLPRRGHYVSEEVC